MRLWQAVELQKKLLSEEQFTCVSLCRTRNDLVFQVVPCSRAQCLDQVSRLEQHPELLESVCMLDAVMG